MKINVTFFDYFTFGFDLFTVSTSRSRRFG